MDRGQERVADQLVVERQNRGQLVAAPVKADTQKTDIGDAADQGLERPIAAFLDDLDGFGPWPVHALPSVGLGLPASMVNAPEAVATGSPSSSSWAVARTKATVRVA